MADRLDAIEIEITVPELRLPARPGVRFVFPHAPMRPVTINGGSVMRAWYDIRDDQGQRREDPAGVRASQKAIEVLIQREKERGVPAAAIVLAGFSQGGAIALHTGLRHGERLAGVLALSCSLPLADTLAAESAPANRDVPIFMAHGTHDPMIPMARALRAREVLTGLGYPVEWHEYPMPHAVCAQESAGDLPEILDQHRVELRLLRLVRAAKHGRGMVGGDRLGRPARRREAAAVLRDPEGVTEDRAGGGGAEADQDVRMDRRQLGFEPRAAGRQLGRSRRLVDPALAALLELEVLDRVGDVDSLAVEADLGQRPVEHLAGRADERRAMPVFLISRLLTHEYDARVGRPAAEDRLGGVTVEVAAGAARGGRAELGDSGARGHERRGALDLSRGVALPRQERAEPPHARIARVLQEVVILVDESPERVVEDLPARGIGRRRRLAREVEELARHPHGGGRRRSLGGQQRLLAGPGLAPPDIGRRHALAQERARRRLPALERRLDLHRPHDGDATRSPDPRTAISHRGLLASDVGRGGF